MPEADPHFEIAIAGAGLAGLGMAIALKEDGREDFVVLERADDLGGTWRDNSYPGCACDIPSVLYSYTDEQNPEWSQAFAGQPEIWAYMQDVARRHELEEHFRFNHEITEARWSVEDQRWTIETAGGTITADVLISAAGALADPSIPELPGLERFTGTIFHSARWDHEHELEGRSVAVVGTGASAIQFVPEIQPEVARLHLFQRTPPWVLPRENPRDPVALARALRPPSASARAGPGQCLLAAGDISHRLPSPGRDARGPTTRARPHRQAGRRPRAAGEADSRLPSRLQADTRLQHLVSGPVRRERRCDHHRHQGGPRAIGDRRRWDRARGRHDHLRHRLSGHRHAVRPPGAGS